MIKLWPKISQTPWRPLGFPVTNPGILGRIGHKGYVQENWGSDLSSDKSPWPNVFGDPWSYIPLSVPFHQLFFTDSFSSAFLLKLTCVAVETRPDLPSALHDVPSTFLCASWHCALCHPHTPGMADFRLHFHTWVLWPDLYEKMLWESKFVLLLQCCYTVISLTPCKYRCRGLRFK